MLPAVERLTDVRGTLRRATSTDVAAAETIIADALRAYGLPFEPEGRDADVRAFGSRDDHDDFAFCLGEEVVGIVSVGPHGDDGVAWVSKVFVAAEARGRGIGRTLLRKAHDAARARGYERVGLRTRVIFREAIALYESKRYLALPSDPPRLGASDVVYFRSL